MKTPKSVLLTITISSLILLSACKEPVTFEEAGATSSDFLIDAIHEISDVMVHDIFSPVVASRIYAYSTIAAYEAVALNNEEYRSLGGQIHEFTEGPVNDNPDVSVELAGVHAALEVGKALVFSVEMLEEYQDSLYQSLRDKGVPKKAVDASIKYGDEIAKHVMAWAATDNYKETRGTPKYPVTDEPGRWIPTPPAYMDAIEPNWNKIRTLVMDSPDQFKPVPPYPYNMDKSSEFYKQVKEVYDIGVNLDDEQRAIAKFWDCNPFAVQLKGHFMFSIKKITPGGHWMGIVGVTAKTANADFPKTAEAYAQTSIALFDAFISSWDEKFRSNLIRPETVINQSIDPDWVPLLQTPPFPEYTSGHSVISRAAAEALTDIFGDSFYFEDTTEEEFGLPMRSFDSFIEASTEAAWSRMYGGIHYRMAAENGITQGSGVGKLVVERIELGKKSPSSKP